MSDTHLTDVAEIEGQTALHVVEGFVWCDKWNEVHADTLNPQGYVEDGKQDYCKPEDHRAVFMDSDDNVNPRWDDREPIEPMSKDGVYVCNCECHLPAGWRWKEGDPRPLNLRICGKCSHVRHMSGEFAVPEPVRPNPVPLTVRRHTDESRAIWRANLMDALPQDMLQEDRERIADSLLDTAIAMGHELRRKRLVDKLMDAVEELSNFHISGTSEWADLMRDAAEEIRSVL